MNTDSYAYLGLKVRDLWNRYLGSESPKTKSELVNTLVTIMEKAEADLGLLSVFLSPRVDEIIDQRDSGKGY